MKIGVAIIISLLAIVALVAEVILYLFLGMGAALAGGQAAVGGIAFFFVGLMIVTAAAAVLAPVGAVVEMVAKKANVGAWILVAGLAVVALGYVGLNAVGYAVGSHRATASSLAVTGDSPAGTKSPSAAKEGTGTATPLLEVRLLKKALTKQDYQDFVFFDVEWHATGLKKAARAIKGVLHFQDLFGETKMKVNWTINTPPAPGDVYVERGTGFEYNMFMNDHRWVSSTDLANMKAAFVVRNIIYQDGTTEEIKNP